MKFQELEDDRWSRRGPLLPSKAKEGKPRADVFSTGSNPVEFEPTRDAHFGDLAFSLSKYCLVVLASHSRFVKIQLRPLFSDSIPLPAPDIGQGC